jgi:DNA-binding GntR family transcriptional regulator
VAEKLIVPSLVDAVHCALQTRILSGELAAGTPLTEKDVAESYDVARPTAKAALDRLIYNGLLRRSTNKSARVPSLIAADVADLYYSRGFLEREAISAVAGRRQVPQAALEAMAQARADQKGR